MRIAIIGAGFTGLSAAYNLTKEGHDVTVFEKDGLPGGLAIGYKEDGWDWTLEKHYHHWFTNDKSILSLAKEIGFDVLIKRPKTSVFVDSEILQLDSPLSVLQFPKLSFAERLRMIAVLGFLKLNPFWKQLEKFNAATLLPKAMGRKPYTLLWEPLFQNKFGDYATEVSLAWFWARIYKRTPSLAYPSRGFLAFAQAITKNIQNNGGRVLFDTETTSIATDESNSSVHFLSKGKERLEKFDKIIVTVPSALFLKIAPQLPDTYKKALLKLKSLGAINLVLRMKKPFFADNTYWLSVCDKKSPIMAIVEHTNFMDKSHYNNEHILYLGNYLPREHRYFGFTEETLLKAYDTFLSNINNDYKKHIIGMKAFKAPFAQPVIPVNYSKMIPGFTTPLKNIYLANIDQVYPWDRGTNYAVELGEKITKLVS